MALKNIDEELIKKEKKLYFKRCQRM